MPITWKPEYNLGIKVIDDQHHRIADYINQLAELEDQDASAIKGVLYNLIDYTCSHFAFEESLLEEAGYCDLSEHQLTHGAFEKQVNTFTKRHEQGENIVKELEEMLSQWLINHILIEDAVYVETVNKSFAS